MIEPVGWKQDFQVSKHSEFIVELRHAKYASRAPWVRFFGSSIDARNLGYDVNIRSPFIVEVRVCQDNLWGSSVCKIFLVIMIINTTNEAAVYSIHL